MRLFPFLPLLAVTSLLIILVSSDAWFFPARHGGFPKPGPFPSGKHGATTFTMKMEGSMSSISPLTMKSPKSLARKLMSRRRKTMVVNVNWKHEDSARPTSTMQRTSRRRTKERKNALSKVSTTANRMTSLSTPWKTSLDDPSFDCVFMPFWEYHWSIMKASLKDLKLIPTQCRTLTSHHPKRSRVVTWTASSAEYRKIRMTYLDGGPAQQIFTTVCYPRGDLPLFGLDLLHFQGGQRQLAICDFQPLYDCQDASTYEDDLQRVRDQYPHLQEEMTTRFFDPSRYFSKQTLLGRFSDVSKKSACGTVESSGSHEPKDILWDQVWPAYKAYWETHVDLVVQDTRVQSSQTGSSSSVLSREKYILELHRQYDEYISECDPAHPMFAALFGKEEAEDYIYDILFPLAQRPGKHECM